VDLPRQEEEQRPDIQESELPPRTKLLHEAARLINGDRNNDYGDPVDDFAMTAQLWQVYLRRAMEARSLEEIYLDPHDVAVMMMLLKISRLSWTPAKRDHWLDIVGYAGCGWECIESTYL
jgi:hypothetical protein